MDWQLCQTVCYSYVRVISHDSDTTSHLGTESLETAYLFEEPLFKTFWGEKECIVYTTVHSAHRFNCIEKMVTSAVHAIPQSYNSKSRTLSF